MFFLKFFHMMKYIRANSSIYMEGSEKLLCISFYDDTLASENELKIMPYIPFLTSSLFFRV